jgi:hypothetical protein
MRIPWGKLAFLGAVLAAYPAFVLGYTWISVFKSDFKGGGNGPLDAYRHALASAIVAHTLGESAVELISTLFESGPGESHAMDRHNNRIGAKIGAASFFELEPAVRKAVENGKVNTTDPNQISWLPETRWKHNRVW